MNDRNWESLIIPAVLLNNDNFELLHVEIFPGECKVELELCVSTYDDSEVEFVEAVADNPTEALNKAIAEAVERKYLPQEGFEDYPSP